MLPDGSVLVGAPPAVANGLSPLPGSAVPTAQRLAQPTAVFHIPVPFGRAAELVKLLYEFFGDTFEFQLNAEAMAALPVDQIKEIQDYMRQRARGVEDQY